MKSSPRPVLLTSLLLTALTTPLTGQTARNHLYDKFQIGAFFTDVIFGAKERVDGIHGFGDEINLSKDLGIPGYALKPRFDLRWRPGRRHELELGYQFADVSGDKTLTRSFDFADTSFTAGLRVQTRYKSDNAFLTYRFAFMAREKTQVGIGVGVGIYLFDTEIDALTGVAGGGKPDSVSYSSSRNQPGPTASLGLYGRFALGKAWYLDADLRAMGVTIDSYGVSIVEGGAAARYFVSSKVGIEAGYALSAVNIDVAPRSSGRGGGKIQYSMQSLRLGLVYAL